MNPAPAFNALALRLDGVTSIEASAGTGKTHSITRLWLRLLVEARLPVDRILVSTFTHAATAELRERLLRTLRTALTAAREAREGVALGDGATDEVQWIRQWLEDHRDQADAVVAHLAHCLSAFDLAPIQTIHGFCQSLIGRHALELACDPDLAIREDCERIVRQVTDDFILELSDSRVADVGALRKVARTLMARPAAEVRGVGWSPEHLAEAKARCRERILAEAPGAITKLSNARSLASVRQRIDDLGQRGRWEALTKAQAEKLPTAFVSLWESYHRLESAEARWPASRLADRLRERLPGLQAKAGIRTFDDILRTVRDALRDQGPEGPLARAVRGRLRAAILDECQDSDTLQIEVFRELFEHPDIRSFLVIGDPKQSIYRFRGADLASYRALAEHATAAPRMTVNHRSDPALIEALNQLYGPAFQFPDSLAGDRPFDYVPVTAQAKANRLFDPADPGALVIHASVEDNRPRAANRLASWAAQEIARLLSEPVELIDRHSGQRRRLGPGDIGVLAASHRDLRRVRRALQALGIACRSSGKGLGSVLDSDEALDVLGWLELLEALNHHARLMGRLSAFLLGPLGAATAKQVLELQARPAEQAALLRKLTQSRHDLTRVGPLPGLLRWIQSEGIAASTLRFVDGERRLTNWRQVGALLQKRFEEGLRSPEALAAWLSRQIGRAPESIDGASATTASESALMRLETDAPAVRLDTIHGAKGLEYPVVFCPFAGAPPGRSRQGTPPAAVARLADRWVVDLGSDQFEEILQAAEAQEAEEDHRRLYVALTRARHRLYLGIGPKVADSPLEKLPGLTAAIARSAERNSQTTPPRPTDGGLSPAADPCGAVSAPESPGPAPAPPLAAPPAEPAMPQPLWTHHSFTSLSRSDLDHEPAAADRDLGMPGSAAEGGGMGAPPTAPDRVDAAMVIPGRPSMPAAVPPADDPLAALGSAGNVLGDRLHRALEDVLGNGRDLGSAVAGLDDPTAWTSSLQGILEANLELMPEVRFRLGDLRGRCITEMEFHLPVDILSPRTLSEALEQDPAVNAIPGGTAWARGLSEWTFPGFTGFLRGFIDLIFELQGRWYVADYKSNRLDTYSRPRLDRAMLESNYLLQARLYLVALHRHLKANLSDYDPAQHLGGVAYLFVRGFPSQGVWFEAPSRETLARLDALFAIPAIQSIPTAPAATPPVDPVFEP